MSANNGPKGRRGFFNIDIMCCGEVMSVLAEGSNNRHSYNYCHMERVSTLCSGYTSVQRDMSN